MDLVKYEQILADLTSGSSPWTSTIGHDKHEWWIEYHSPADGRKLAVIKAAEFYVDLTVEGRFSTATIIEFCTTEEVTVALHYYRSAVDAYLSKPTEYAWSRRGNRYIVIRLPDGEELRLTQSLAGILENILKRRER